MTKLKCAELSLYNKVELWHIDDVINPCAVVRSDPQKMQNCKLPFDSLLNAFGPIALTKFKLWVMDDVIDTLWWGQNRKNAKLLIAFWLLSNAFGPISLWQSLKMSHGNPTDPLWWGQTPKVMHLHCGSRWTIGLKLVTLETQLLRNKYRNKYL